LRLSLLFLGNLLKINKGKQKTASVSNFLKNPNFISQLKYLMTREDLIMTKEEWKEVLGAVQLHV
jgi:Mn-containing catalase